MNVVSFLVVLALVKREPKQLSVLVNKFVKEYLYLQGSWTTMLGPLFTAASQVKISAGADGGSRFRVYGQETLRSGPHRHQRTIFSVCVCKVTFKHLPQPRSF